MGVWGFRVSSHLRPCGTTSIKPGQIHALGPHHEEKQKIRMPLSWTLVTGSISTGGTGDIAARLRCWVIPANLKKVKQ